VNILQVFIEGGYDPAFVEVLSFEHVNLAELADKLRKSENYGGLVLTSQNASSSIACAIERGLLSRDEVVSGWSSLPVYVVGGATASSVCSLGLECVGEESGKAETLSDFIIHRHSMLCCSL
jgi:uroporphyrinogen-III synthase